MTRTISIAFAALLIGVIIGWKAQYSTGYNNDIQWKLQRAASQGDVDEMKRLISAGANPRKQPTSDFGEGSSPLFAAAAAGQPDTVEFLIAEGADVNEVESTETPLDMAHYKKQEADKTIEILKRHGAKTLFELPGMNPKVTEQDAFVHPPPEPPRK